MRIYVIITLLTIAACTSPSESTAPAKNQLEAATPSTEAPVRPPAPPQADTAQGQHVVIVSGVQLTLPSAMRRMSEQEIRSKYPQVPQAAFTDPTTSINLVVNHTPTPVTTETLPTVFAQISQQIRQGAALVGGLREEIHHKNGRTVCTLSFVSQAIDSQIYNLMFMTEVDGRLWIASYNCTTDKRTQGEADAQSIMESLQVLP